MSDNNMARMYAIVVGVVLVAVGLLGFISNPIVSNSDTAIFRVNAIHNIVHLLTGAAALAIGFGIRDRLQQANALIVLGVAYALVLVLTLVSPTLFGLFGDAPVNVADHVLHLALAVASIAIGYMGRTASPMRPAMR